MKEQDITYVEVKKVRSAKGKQGLATGVIDQLHDSISKEGLFNPIVIRPDPESPGHYLIVQGRHRFYVVAKLMKEDVIAARIFEDMSEEEAELAALTENACRTHAKPQDRLLALRKWQEVYRKHFPFLEGRKASGHSRWANSTKAEAKAKAIEEEKARDEDEESVATVAESNGRVGLNSGCQAEQVTAEIEDAAGADAEKKAAGERIIRARAMATTGVGYRTLSRELKINTNLDEEQVYVLGLVECTQQGMIQIIDATDDKVKRGQIVNLVASGMDIDEAIREVLGTQATAKAETKEVGEVEAMAGSETDQEWFARECGEFAGFLGDIDQYKSDAILYRQLMAERYAHRKKVKAIIKEYERTRKGKTFGRFYWTVYNYLNSSHPNSWVICGTCKGKGSVDGQECSSCRGACYRTKAEKYV